MPVVSERIDHDVEIEVFCGRCGEGICGETDLRYSKTRRVPQFVVNCSECDKTIQELKKDVERLEEDLREQGYQLQTTISELEAERRIRDQAD